MPQERRKGAPSSSSPLPHDFLKMVCGVFTTNFDAGLKALTAHSQGEFSFEASGAIYSDELVLSITLVEKDEIAATSVYASCDFDPKASSPTVQDLLALCVDGIGVIFGHLLDPSEQERIDQIASQSLSAMDNVPFHWSEMKVERKRIYIKVDKANPKLEQMADEWLSKNDPGLKNLEEQNQKDAEGLFVTGPNSKKAGGRGSAGGTLH